MSRQFRIRSLNEDFLTARAWPDRLAGSFKESEGLRDAVRLVVPTPAAFTPAAAVEPGPRLVETTFAEPALTTLPRPEAAATSPSGTIPAIAGAFPLSTPNGFALESGAGVAIMGASSGSSGGTALGAATAAAAGPYLILFSDDLGPGLVVDAAKREILTGGAQDPELGGGDGDTLVLAGPLAGAATLPVALHGLETVVLQAGASYDLASTDDQVARGATLEINAIPLGPGDTIAFDGSAESDGRFLFLGSGGDDIFRGGAGDDLLFGGGGGDELHGGGGADVFSYNAASQSSGTGYDSLVDFDPTADSIDLPVAVTGFHLAIQGGALSSATFDDDLAAALGPGGLAAGTAILFAPDSGDLAGTLFLIVDGNGEAGYQAGEDFVFALPNADIADLSSHTGFFV